MDIMKNQNEYMKTEVETFFQEEVTELIYDNDKLEEWKRLNESLGLTGQQSLAKPDKSPIPFMFMKESVNSIFQVLCPRETEYKSFDITPIPLEILKLISLSVEEGYFSTILIKWDDQTPDPVVIGQVKKYGEWQNYNWDTAKEASEALGKEVSKWNCETKNYLIGKWGDVKYSMDQLAEMAKGRHMKSERKRLEDYIADYEKQLEQLVSTTDERFAV